MDKEFPINPFERYEDDIVVHCKTERQAKNLLQEIKQRMQTCKLKLHTEKTKIVNLRGTSHKKYAKKYDFLGFTIKLKAYIKNGRTMAIPGVFVSQKSKTGIMEKFKAMNLHKRRIPLEKIAREINPIIRGIMNYYHKFRDNIMYHVWNQLNVRLLKWVKWEKGLFKKAAIRYLHSKYKERPDLFCHWLLVHLINLHKFV
jgi:RNA-directed DNA polymerase